MRWKNINITKENFEKEVLNYDKLTVVDFWAEWCGPCKMLAPIINQIEDAYGEKIKVCKINIDNEGELAIMYNVMSIRTLKFFKNGEVVEMLIGVHSKNDIKAVIEKHV